MPSHDKYFVRSHDVFVRSCQVMPSGDVFPSHQGRSQTFKRGGGGGGGGGWICVSERPNKWENGGGGGGCLDSANSTNGGARGREGGGVLSTFSQLKKCVVVVRTDSNSGSPARSIKSYGHE